METNIVLFAAYRESLNGVLVRIDESRLDRYQKVKVVEVNPIGNTFVVFDKVDESRTFLGNWDKTKNEFMAHPTGSFIGRVFQRVWSEAICRSPDLVRKLEQL